MTATETTHHENRLARETSPYLLQHKDNPVAWWAWGPEALAEAKRTNKPILLSVGYAACHWCHVMAHESFEDDATARVMNELFVNIKVDREERPDIDQIYMAALHHLGEQGGWPLTMFLTPDGEPIWGGTYFPKSSRYGKPAFVDVLREIARLFREEPQKIEQNRAALMERLAGAARTRRRRRSSARPSSTTPRVSSAASSIRSTAARAARRNFRKLRCSSFFGAPDCAPARRATSRPSTSRCTTSARAASTIISAAAFRATRSTSAGSSRISRKCSTTTRSSLNFSPSRICAFGKPLYRQRAQETVAWLAREMTNAGGAFCASLDADSEGEEGKFYVWSYDEVLRELGSEDGEFFARHYDVTPQGNFEGHNILNRLKPQERSDADEARLAGAARKTPRRARDARASRPRRQDSCRLERIDDRRARQRQPNARRAVLARHGGSAPSISSRAR